jgi:type II secretory pathway component GspD/PulD (secretin)
MDAAIMSKALGFDTQKIQQLVDVYHQPLIQIKLRVVEVVRADNLDVNSVLEYVSRGNTVGSLTSGGPLNRGTGATGFQNTRAGSNFTAPDGLISSLAAGSGGLVNLTSEHINWAVSFLSTELNADVITAPEVVTLNGQNVEFVSGSKLPFQLGQNVIQGTNNNIQQFFFKNVGTYVSVTPKIVNWGFHGEGQGEAAIIESDVENWNLLIESMLDREIMKLDSQ